MSASEKMKLKRTLGWVLLGVGLLEWAFLAYGNLLQGWSQIFSGEHPNSIHWFAYGIMALTALSGTLLAIAPVRSHAR